MTHAPIPAFTDSRTPSAVDPATPSVDSPNLLSASDVTALVSMPWRYASAKDGILKILAVSGDGDCTTLAGIVIDYSSAEVELGVYATTDRARQACADPLQTVVISVPLDGPLGGRALVHLASSPDWHLPSDAGR